MQKPKEMAKAGKQVGKKVLASDAAQDVVGVVVDDLKEVAVDKADDVAENVKARAARAGGRPPKQTNAPKSPAKRTVAKKSSTRKSSAKRTGAKKTSTRKSSAKRTGAKKSS